MALSAHLKSWSGVGLRHLPAGARYDVLDFRFAGRGADNRWNDPGDPTLYLAGDQGVLIAEWGRHFAINRDPLLKPLARERRVFRLDLALDQVIDLRTAPVWDELSLGNAPHCFLQLEVARATARFIRATTAAQGMLVPSMGFLDKLDRWCLVLFLEKLGGPKSFISSVTNTGVLQMSEDDLAV
jgi:RES domain-containing protein